MVRTLGDGCSPLNIAQLSFLSCVVHPQIYYTVLQTNTYFCSTCLLFSIPCCLQGFSIALFYSKVVYFTPSFLYIAMLKCPSTISFCVGKTKKSSKVLTVDNKLGNVKQKSEGASIIQCPHTRTVYKIMFLTITLS